MRGTDNGLYWDRRWRETGRDPEGFSALDVYPVRYAEMVMDRPGDRSIDLGAGLGRLVKHYRARGHDISGIERSEVAVERMLADDPALPVRTGDVRNLPFPDDHFDVVLAFGLFHNIETGLDDALAETARCLRPGGRFCISMRPDNIEMRLNEWYWAYRNRGSGPRRSFHKWLAGEEEFWRLLEGHGLRSRRGYRARNVSLLYRAPFLRDRRRVRETERRGAGYRLNRLGRRLDRGLVGAAPAQFCNVVVYVGQKDGPAW